MGPVPSRLFPYEAVCSDGLTPPSRAWMFDLRRSFMSAFCVLLAGALASVFMACGGGDSKGSASSPTVFGTSSDPSRVIAPGKVKPVNIVMAGADWYVGQDNFVFGITNGKDEPEGGATAVVTFYDLRGKDPKPVAQGEGCDVVLAGVAEEDFRHGTEFMVTRVVSG